MPPSYLPPLPPTHSQHNNTRTTHAQALHWEDPDALPPTLPDLVLGSDLLYSGGSLVPLATKIHALLLPRRGVCLLVQDDDCVPLAVATRRRFLEEVCRPLFDVDEVALGGVLAPGWRSPTVRCWRLRVKVPPAG
jgi:hypothetical protein